MTQIPVRGPDLFDIERRGLPAAQQSGRDAVGSLRDLDYGAPVIRRTRSKVAVYNTGLWSIAHRHGAHVLDLWGMRAIQDWRMWAEDRIHLSTAGHERVAQAALVGLGLVPDLEAWDDPLAPLPPEARADRWRGNARWARAYALPWVQRRLRRQSSGDLRRAKYPEPVTVETA